MSSQVYIAVSGTCKIIVDTKHMFCTWLSTLPVETVEENLTKTKIDLTLTTTNFCLILVTLLKLKLLPVD